MRDTKDLSQVLRIDGTGCFMEVMLNGLPLDKVQINFLQYDKKAEKGSRTKGAVSIYLDIMEASVLSRDIFSGRIPTLAKVEKVKQQKEGRKYANPVYSKQGGTAANRNNGIAIARLFEITPGASQPWIFCAKQGKAHETTQGLIVMDGPPEVTVRVPCTDQKLKEFAAALDSTVRVWEQLRLIPAITESMQLSNEVRRAAIERAKTNAVNGAGGA